MNKLSPNFSLAWKGNFLRKLTNTIIVYLLCPIMLQGLKKFPRVGHIMKYKVLQFCTKVDINYRFTLKGIFFFLNLTDVNFVYFMYLSKYYNVWKKVIKVDHKIQGSIIFWQIGLGYFFWENWLLSLLSICCAPSYYKV